MTNFPTLTAAELKVALSSPHRSQAALAERLGIDPSAVSRILNGKRQIKIAEAPKIIQYLNDTAVTPGSKAYWTPSKTDNQGVANFLRVHAVGERGSLSQVAASACLNLIENMMIGTNHYYATNPFVKNSVSAEFLKMLEYHADILVTISTGAGLISYENAPSCHALLRLVEIAAEKSSADLERDQYALALAKTAARVAQDEQIELSDLKRRLAFQIGTIALAAVDFDRTASKELRRIARELEDGAEGD